MGKLYPKLRALAAKYRKFFQIWFYLYRRVRSGSLGEEEIAQILSQLDEGWQIENNIYLKDIGDIDFFVMSPDKRIFVLEVKAHTGFVTTDGKTLLRIDKFKGVEKLFEKDFLNQVMKQALTIRKQRQLPFVTPVIVFTRAELHLINSKIRGVYVIEKNQLLEFLQNHSSSPKDSFSKEPKIRVLKM